MGTTKAIRIQTGIRMREQTYQAVKAFAEKSGVTFSDAVSALVQIGLLEKANYGFDVSGRPFKLPTQEGNHVQS